MSDSNHVLFASDAVTQEALLHIIKFGQRKLSKQIDTAYDARRHGCDMHAAAQPLATALRQPHDEARRDGRPGRPPRADSACSTSLVGTHADAWAWVLRSAPCRATDATRDEQREGD